MYSFPPLAAAIGVLYTIVTGLTSAFDPLLGTSAAAAAIIALTVIIRIAIIPLGLAQARAEHTRAALQPKLREIQRKYGSNRERLNRELTELYRREGTTPLAGCLPMLAQAPVFMAVYGMFLTTEIGGQPNNLLTSTLGGVPLGTSLLEIGTLGAGLVSALAVFGTLLALLTLVAFAMRRLMPVMAPTSGGAPPAAAAVVRWLPFGVVAVATFVPLAAGLYLLTTTAWTAGERPLLRRLTAPAGAHGGR